MNLLGHEEEESAAYVERRWLVYLDGLPLAPAYPLSMHDAAELWQFFARQPDATVDIHQVVTAPR